MSNQEKCWMDILAAPARRRRPCGPENFATFDIPKTPFSLSFAEGALQCRNALHSRGRTKSSLKQSSTAQRNVEDHRKMTISRTAFLSRNCCSLRW